MTGWIKIEKSTPHKPEIRQAARLCKVNQPTAFWGFFLLWAYLDDHCEDGFMPGFTADDVSDIAGISGFGKALADAGWLSFDTSGMTIRNWDRHNGTSAKARALASERKRRERDRKRHADSVTEA